MQVFLSVFSLESDGVIKRDNNRLRMIYVTEKYQKKCWYIYRLKKYLRLVHPISSVPGSGKKKKYLRSFSVVPGCKILRLKK